MNIPKENNKTEHKTPDLQTETRNKTRSNKNPSKINKQTMNLPSLTLHSPAKDFGA